MIRNLIEALEATGLLAAIAVAVAVLAGIVRGLIKIVRGR